MRRFIEILEKNYNDRLDSEHENISSKEEYISQYIFEFTTYDSDMDKVFVDKMMPVLKCILNSTNYNYHQESKENYFNYLSMVHMPFLKDKLEWGSSIRGVWFDDFDKYEFDCGTIRVEEQELSFFIKDLIEWYEV